jgi:rubredoxin-NAD+ reductase
LVVTPFEKMASTLNVVLHQNVTVNDLNLEQQTVSVSGAVFHFSKLILATGAQAIRIPIQSNDNSASRVLSVNSLSDFVPFHAALVADMAVLPKKTIVIMGAGLIGCEFANDLTTAGHTIHIVDPGTRALATLLPEPASEALQSALCAAGDVHFHWSRTVQTVNANHVILNDGSILNADVVLSATGLRANVNLAKTAGLHCERGVVVDKQLCTSHPNIHALGDVAQYQHQGQSSTMPYVMPIMNASKALAATLAGTPTEVVFPVMPIAIKTPACPVLVAPPPLDAVGQWQNKAEHIWYHESPTGTMQGFVLMGKQTSTRSVHIKLLQETLAAIGCNKKNLQ